MELSKRMRAVADLVSEGNIVADIGCDHGYISIDLVSSGKCPKAIAMDIKEGPLEHARINVKKYDLCKYIDIRLSDGVEALQKDEADTLLISGMGGRLMIRILTDGFQRLGFFPELVLQPQSEIETVRQFLREHGYRIADEDFVIEDGKNYPIIKAFYAGEQAVASSDGVYTLRQQDLFGPVLLKKRPADFMLYLEKKKEKAEMLLAKITQPYKRDEMLLLLNDLDYILKHT